ncbi:MAG: spore germination protein [Paenisporosarcina sp.]
MKIWKKARKLIVESKKIISNRVQSMNQSTTDTKQKETTEFKYQSKAAEIKPKAEAQSKPQSMAKGTKPEPATQSKSQSIAKETNPKPATESNSQSKAEEKKPEPAAKSKNQSTAEETKPEPATESKPQSMDKETKPKPATEPKPQSTAKETKPEPATESKPQSTAKETKPEPVADIKPQSTAAETKPEPAAQSKNQPTVAETKPLQKVQSRKEAKAKKTPKSISLETIKTELIDIDDAVVKDYQTKEGLVTVVYLSSLIDPMILHKAIILPLVNDQGEVLSSFDTMDGWNKQKILMAIVNGETVIFHHDKEEYLLAQTFSPPERAISSSENETTVIGPQDSFTESLKTNLSLIKRRIHQTGLKSKDYIIGQETNTKITIMYIEHLVNDENLKVILERIEKLDYTGYVDVVILKQLLEDNPFSPFPQYAATSRPDVVASSLLDGRIVIAMENSQSVMIAPSSFIEMFNSPEDFYNRWTTATLLRILRFTGFFITIMLTPTYISALSYHPGLLPFELLIMTQESRSKVPFPPVIEVLFIELVIEILREAGSRMPTKIGQTIGIVGGIVIGTAAVEAGLVSNTLIVLVAISALLSFLMPNFLMSNASRFVRYIFILAAGMFGLLGQMLALAWLFNHLLNLTSLGTPYMSPVIPRSWSDLKDSVIRLPLVFLQQRTAMSRSKREKKPTK